MVCHKYQMHAISTISIYTVSIHSQFLNHWIYSNKSDLKMLLHFVVCNIRLHFLIDHIIDGRMQMQGAKPTVCSNESTGNITEELDHMFFDKLNWLRDRL